MGNLYFPQLAGGALAQYPIKKTRLVRTIKNVLPDGSMVLLSDPDGAHLLWQLGYTELSPEDVAALQNHFTACVGAYRAFTFIDPTDNMLVSSADLTGAAWQTSSFIEISSGAADPDGGTAAFMLVNNGQATQEISQTLNVPANYQYCFSLYAMAAQPGTLTLIRGQGLSTAESTAVAIGPAWNRLISSGKVNDSGTTFTIAVSLAPGQSVDLYGLQLETQIAPSRYRPTMQMGGVYANAHWGIDQLTISADAPNLSSTSFTIETAL